MLSPRKRLEKIFFTSLFFLMFIGVFALAVPIAEAAKSFYTPNSSSRPIWSDNSFYIVFEMDEQACRKAYGKNWKKRCEARIGRSGTVAKGIKPINWPEGEWIWDTGIVLKFTPSQSWKSGTRYTVDISKLQIPPSVQLSETQVSFVAIPRCARIDSEKVWIDPSGKAEHAISFGMDFTERLSQQMRKQVMDKATINVTDSVDLKLSKPEWVWLNNNTRAVVKSRILSMPKQKSTVKLIIPNIRPIWYDNDENMWNFPNRNAEKKMVVPGIDSLFSMKKIELESWQNKSLQQEQHLVFQFTQRVSGQDLLKALTVLELPKTRSKENIVPTNWTKGGISPKSLEQARKITPKLVQIPGQTEDLIRFRLDTTPGSYILWKVEKGFGPTNVKGEKKPLARALEGIELVPTGDNRLEFLQQGNILMLQSDIALVSENVDTIEWTAYRFKDTSLALPFLETMDLEYISENDIYPASTSSSGKVTLKDNDSGDKKASYTSKPSFTTLESKKIFANSKGKTTPGVIVLEVKGSRDGRTVASDRRLLIYSNMAMVVKQMPDKTRQVFVSYLENAKPLPGVKVQLLGANSLPIAEAQTDATGMATLPDVSYFTKEKYPSAIVVRRSAWDGEEEILWMSLKDYTRQVNLSNFVDVTGKQSSVNNLNAFVFSERGIFRPGETLNFGTLLRSNNWQLMPSSMPLLAQVFDPNWRKVYEKKFTAGDGIHSFTWQIPENVQTGTYTLNVKTPAGKIDNQGSDSSAVLGTRTVKVENFLPDTLRLRTELVDTANAQEVKSLPAMGWLVTSDKPGDTALRVYLSSLFGQVATNRRVTASMTLSPATLSFKGFKDYTFQDVSPYFNENDDPIKRNLKGSVTDDKGQAIVPLDFSQWRYGTLSCTIDTEGYEPDGGRAVSQTQTFLLSPLPYMLGFKAGEGADNKDFIIQGSTAKMLFKALNANLKPADLGNLVFSISSRNMASSLVTDSRGLYTITQTPVETEIAQNEVSISDQGELIWDLPTKDVGEFVLNVKISKNTKQTDGLGKVLKEGTILARVPFTIVGNDDLRPSLTSLNYLPPAKLHLKTDKTDYAGGDTAKIMVTAPYEGVALISLERDKVASYKWVQLPVGNSMHELEIPKEFIGRGYIQVLMGRGPKSDNIFLQPQSVAITPITVNTSERTVELKITAPEKSLPGKPLRWRIENPQGKPTKAVLFAVDEGVLQLTRYATPKPINYLLLDRALEVLTSELFDRIMPDNKKLLKRLSAFGGDGSDGFVAAMLGTFQNPFKRKQEAPMTWWSGVVDIPANGLDLEIPVPSYYNGNVRIMAVVHEANAVGSADANVIIQDTQILSPQLPTMASLGDNFDAGIGVTNTTDKEVTLELSLVLDDKSATKDLTFSGLAKSVTLGPKSEKLLPFQVKVGQTPGEATLRFSTVDAQGVRKERNTSISIRPAVFPRHSQRTFLLNGSADIHVQRNLLPYKAKNTLTLSPIPLPLLQATLGYLADYPYDCVEQSLSKAFPLILLSSSPIGKQLEAVTPSLSPKKKEEIITNANNALISAYSSYDGVTIWPDNGPSDLLLTAYAADYVLAMRDANMLPPVGMMPAIFETLERKIDRTPDDLNELRAYAYASWVLARAGYVVSKQLELNESFVRNTDMDIPESDIYNSFMAGAYAALYMQEQAELHLGKLDQEHVATWTNNDGMLDLLAQLGMHARILAMHYPEELQKAIPSLQKNYIEGLNHAHTTMGAAMVAASLLDIVKASVDEQYDLSDLQVTCGKSKGTEKVKAQIFPNFYVLEAPMCSLFEVTLPVGKKMYAQLQSHGYDAVLPKKAAENGLRVERVYTLKDGTPLEGDVVQGQVLKVQLKARSLAKDEVSVAVADLIPGGFELVLNGDGDSVTSYDLNLFRGEDRVIAFFTANKNTTTVTYHIRAITKGNFTLPAAYGEGLYDYTLNGHTAAGRIKVVEAKD